MNYLDVIRIVAEEFGVSKYLIRERDRRAKIALARQTVCFILWKKFECTLEYTARAVNRICHGTVIHAIRNIKNRRKTEPYTDALISRCEDRIDTFIEEYKNAKSV